MPQLKSRRRERFAVELAGLAPLATAYVLAGYRDTPWAPFNASKLAHVPEVRDRIAELTDQFAVAAGLKLEKLQQQLLPLAAADVGSLFVTDRIAGVAVPRYKSLDEMPGALRAAIKSIKFDPEKGGIVHVELHNKIDATMLLLRTIGGLVDRQELTGKDGENLSLEALVLASFAVKPDGAADTAAADGDDAAAAADGDVGYGGAGAGVDDGDTAAADGTDEADDLRKMMERNIRREREGKP